MGDFGHDRVAGVAVGIWFLLRPIPLERELGGFSAVLNGGFDAKAGGIYGRRLHTLVPARQTTLFWIRHEMARSRKLRAGPFRTQ